MRVPGSITTRRFLNNYSSSIARLNDLTNKVMTGRKFDKVSDDPTSASKAFLVRRQLARIDMYQSNLNSSKDLLSSAETSATKVSDSIKTAYKALVKGLSDTNATNRDVIATQIEGYRDEIIKTMNNNFAGRYLFGGSGNEAPFTLGTDGMLLFNGTPVSTAASAADFTSNKDVFVDIGIGMEIDTLGNVDPQTALKISTSGIEFLGFGTDADGLENNVCDSLTSIAKLLRQPNMDGDLGSKYIGKLEAQQSKVLTGIADIGNRVNFIEYNIDRLKSDTLTLQETQNGIELVNPAEAITNLKTEEASYKACLQIGPRLIQNSLFDYIG